MFETSTIVIFIAIVWTIIIVALFSLSGISRRESKKIDAEIVAIKAVADTGELDISEEELKLHRDAGGNITNVVTSMINAKTQGKELSFSEACAQDLS